MRFSIYCASFMYIWSFLRGWGRWGVCISLIGTGPYYYLIYYLIFYLINNMLILFDIRINSNNIYNNNVINVYNDIISVTQQRLYVFVSQRVSINVYVRARILFLNVVPDYVQGIPLVQGSLKMIRDNVQGSLKIIRDNIQGSLKLIRNNVQSNCKA